MKQKCLTLLVPALVVFAAAVGGTTVLFASNRSPSSTNYSCARTTVGVDGNTVDIVVLVNGSSSVGISQQVSQFDGRTEVEINVEFGDESIAISGETAENGSLVLNVTRDDTVVNESVVVDGSDRALVVRVDGDGDVHVSREENAGGCPCDTRTGESEVNVDVEGGVVDADEGFEVNVERDDEDAPVYEPDGGRNGECPGCTCSASSTEISPPPRRSSPRLGTGVDVMQVLTRLNDLAGLARPNLATDCVRTTGETTADCLDET